MSEVKRWEPRNTSLGYDMQPIPSGSFVLSCDYDALAAQRDEGLARKAELREENSALRELHCQTFEENKRLLEGFYQQVTDEDLKKIADFVGNGDLPERSFFMRPDAAYLANVSMHMVRDVQAMRQRLTVAEKDAARYRWLRSTECWADAQREIEPLWIVDSYEDVTNQDGEMLDKAIDAAIALEASPGCSDGEKIECGACPGCTGTCRHREETP